jgi:hypothetical protein
MAANFDAQAFMSQSVEGTAELATEPTLIPVGEYEAVVDKVDAKPPRPESEWNGVTVSVNWEIMDEALRSKLNRVKIIVTQYIPVELDENGRIAKGGDKNWRLWQVKDALGQKTIDPWNPKLLEGAGPAIVRIKHNSYQGNTSSQVDRVAARK